MAEAQNGHENPLDTVPEETPPHMQEENLTTGEPRSEDPRNFDEMLNQLENEAYTQTEFSEKLLEMTTQRDDCRREMQDLLKRAKQADRRQDYKDGLQELEQYNNFKVKLNVALAKLADMKAVSEKLNVH